MSVERKVDQILTNRDPKEHSSLLCALIEEVISGQVPTQCVSLFSRLLQPDIQQQLSKTCATFFASRCNQLAKEGLAEIGPQCIADMKSKGGLYDEADYIMKNELFEYYLSCCEYADAAQVLAAVSIDSVTKVLSATEKVDLLIKVAECYLMLKETMEAEIFTNKASQFMNEVAAEELALQLRYRAVVAQVYDGNRKFIEAAIKYYELSQFRDSNIVAGDLLQLLGKAVTCAVLAKTGPQRTRVLGLLYNDTRIPQLEGTPPFCSHPEILRKIHRDSIVQEDELRQFEDSLEAHQKAITSDNAMTIVQKSIIEHNMIATSKLYCNIRLEELQRILRLGSVHQAEKIASRMIMENRLAGEIDQTEGTLTFFDEDSAAGDGQRRSRDARVGRVCEQVEKCSALAAALLE